MTEENQKKLYDHFIKTGQVDRAKKISDVPRYAHFVKKEEVKTDSKKEVKEKK